MRTITLLSIFVITAATLNAQNYQQNAPPVQQTKAPVDCYTRNLDNGNAALRRGEARVALRYFNDAKNCQDAQGNSRRANEIASRIERCEEQLGIKKTVQEDAVAVDKSLLVAGSNKRSFSSEIPNIRRNYTPSQQFLKDTVEECFQRMTEEADRAFRLKFWEDAAALYRAAKNCANADQKDRQRMSEKITACRNAAENELFAKQQEAERQARHAIAANLADDAQELLKNTDRSLAFRLADFANQYVAPDDNPDCVQAMFDAWYYQPNEASKNKEDALYHPVFCYELANNLGEDTQIRFEEQPDGTQWLWAFVPKTGDLFAWEMPSMKLVQVFGTGENNQYNGFDISPSGELIFWGKNFFELRQGARTIRIDVPQTSNWCFSTRGDEFFYLHPVEEKIYVLDIQEAFAQQFARKNTKGANLSPIVAAKREFVSGIPANLLAMQYIKGKFWLGFSDRIEVLGKPGKGQPWKREKVFPFDGITIPENVDSKLLQLQMFPNEGRAILGYSEQTWVINLDTAAQGRPGFTMESARPLAVSRNAQKLACEYTGYYLSYSFLLLDLVTGDTLVRQPIPQYLDYAIYKGSFSTDSKWMAASTKSGNISVWSLQDAPTVWTSKLPVDVVNRPFFSPNGARLFVNSVDTSFIFNTSSPKTGARVIQNFVNSLAGSSDDWVMRQANPDSAELIQLSTEQRLSFPLKNQGYPYLYTIDKEGSNLVAYLSDWQTVEVYSIKTGKFIARKTFEGGSIGELYFLPGSNKLMVIQHQVLGEAMNQVSTVKLWSPLNNQEKPRALRLHEYTVHVSALDQSGQLTAFSDGNDIRVFDLQNIENEVLKIRLAKQDFVMAMAFRPGSNLLAAAYSSGKVVFWDHQTGQSAFELQAIPSEELEDMVTEIAKIGFSQNGTLLHIVFSDGRFLSYALDPSYIRQVAQNGSRHLQTFDNQHIIQFNLESALYYPGNFERLATSEDAPLIRSFFQYFQGQALESNNIEQVRNNCERAFYLFERLDGNTKELLLADMGAMYEDYASKLLFRGNLTEAIKVIHFMQNEFGREHTLLNAHKALLQRDLKTAASLYTRYLLTDEHGIPVDPNNQYMTQSLLRDIIRFRDFELIDSIQLGCFCNTVNSAPEFLEFCLASPNHTTSYLTEADQLKWEVFQKRSQAASVFQFASRSKLQEEAFQKTKSLNRRNANEGNAWQEILSLELATTQRKWGVFEQSSPDAVQHFEKAIQLLTETGAHKVISDTSRLAMLTSTHLAWGKHLLSVGKIAEAAEQLYKGLESAQPLSEIVYEVDTLLLANYYDNLVGPIYENMGTAALLMGKPDEARLAYERANVYKMSYGLNTLYTANIAVFEGKEDEAFIEFGGISTAAEAAQAFFTLDRLIETFPEKRPKIEAFKPRLLEVLRRKNPRLVGAEMGFWMAKFKEDYFLGTSSFDSAIVWSKEAMKNAARCAKEQQNAEEYWNQQWLDEHINLPYLLLLGEGAKPNTLKACIQYVEEAETFLTRQDSFYFYYPNRELLKTNHAHALILRNQPGDHEKALELYKAFINGYADLREYDNRDLIIKDIHDFKQVGMVWPEVPALIELLSEQPN